MKKILLAISLLFFTAFTYLVQSKSFTPEKLRTYKPIEIHKPFFIDTVNVKGKTYKEENLLATSISFPAQEQFTNIILPDTAGYYQLVKPATGKMFQLISFYINGNGYGDGKLKITATDRFELYLDNKKVAEKKSVEDSLKSAKSAETKLSGNINGKRAVIKLLTSSDSKIIPTFKVELIPDKTDSTLVYSFTNDTKRYLAIEDILIGKRVNFTSISPSGRLVLMRFTDTDNSGKNHSTIEVFDTQNQNTIFAEQANRKQLRWMNKEDKLTYLEKNNNGQKLISLDPITNELKVIAENLPDESFSYSPDGKYLYYAKKETLDAKSPKGLKRIIAPDDRQDYYRNRYSIIQYQLNTGLSQQLTFGQNSAGISDISSDGRYLLILSSEEDLRERPFRKNSLFLLDLQKGNVDTVWMNQRFVNGAKFSPDAKQIIFTGGPDAFDAIGKNIAKNQIANSYDTQAFIMDLGTKKIMPITKNFYPSVNRVDWNEQDGMIYLNVQEKSFTKIYRYNPKTNKFTIIPLPEELVRSFTLAKNSTDAAFIGSGTANSGRAYVVNLKNNTSKMIADPYKERLQHITLGEVKNWTFTSQMGDKIDGWYYLPPNFDPKKKYPLVVYYYGGTSPTQRTFESTYPLQVYAALGYVVYTLNPSGTTGYGQEFSARHVNAWGKYTADEIVEGTKKFVSAHSYVDGSKIGCIGASYGGFMTQYLLTQTDLFATGVSHAGISSLSSYWGEGYWGYSYSAGASAGSYPWNNAKLYVEQSPLFNADKVTTPLLLLHGTADTNVPPGESIQMFTALKLLGKPVELVMVEGENHAIYNFEKRISWNNTIYAWFAKWLKEDAAWWNDLYPTTNKE